MLPLPQLPFLPVEGFNVERIVRNSRDQLVSAGVEKVEAVGNEVKTKVGLTMSDTADACEEAYNEFKVDSEMSSTLKKVSKNVRKDQDTNKGLDKLAEQLKNGELHAGRGAKKLAGTKTVFYMRSGGEARLFFKYSETEEGVVEIIATQKNLLTLMNNDKSDFLSPGSPMIIVRKLTKEVVEEAIEAYAEINGIFY